MKKFYQKFRNVIFFRKFSRKSFAVFNSLGKQIKIATLGATCSLIVSPILAQSKSDSDSVSKTIDLDEVEVVGQKAAVLIDELPRMVELIPAGEIQSSSSQSFQDFIEYRSNIDIRQRGPFGAQADVSVRGGTFDQTLILLNGINITDPQTGHHSLDLPLDLETISKIEILNGPSARALGANAYNGAINVVAVPSDVNQIKAAVHAGEYGFLRTHIGLNQLYGNTKHLLTLGYTRCNGYTDNTDFGTINLFYSSEYLLTNSSRAYVNFGLSRKDFGANSYYTPRFPDEYESNKNAFLAIGFKSGKLIKTKTQLYWRRHYDHFILIRDNPDFYENYHQTDIFGADYTATYVSAAGKTTFGSTLRSENILSNQLGSELAIPVQIKGGDSLFYTRQAARNSFELFLEHVYQTKYWFISGGLLLHWNSYIPNNLRILPGIDIGYNLNKSVALVGSYNYTLGLPTFTDLNYQGPSNTGNDQLKPYGQHSLEAGLKFHNAKLIFRGVGFYTNGKNNIEWVLNNNTYTFSPINVKQSNNTGVELSMSYKTESEITLDRIFSQVYLGYTYIDTYRDTPDSISKYSNIKQKLVLTLQQNLFKGFSLNWNIMYKERIGNYLTYDFDNNEYVVHNFPNALLLGVKAEYTYRFASVYIEGSNLLDQEYYESGSTPQPGRWIRAGVVVSINSD